MKLQRSSRPDRGAESPPGPHRITYLGAGLVALSVLFVVLIIIDAIKGRPWTEANLVMAGTFGAIGSLFLLIGRGISRRENRIWRGGHHAEATVTSVTSSSFQVTRWDEVRSIIEYNYRDRSGNAHTGTSGYIPQHIAATWRVGDKAQIRVDEQNPAKSVWIARKIAGSHPPAPAIVPLSRFKVAKRIPSFWIGPFVFVVGIVVGGVSRNEWALGGLLISLCGVVLLLAGTRRIWIARRVLDRGVPADATVISIRKSFVGARISEWRYVIRYSYKDSDGNLREGREYLSDAEAFGWKRGSRGRVRFDPRHPGRSIWMGATAP